MKIKYIILGLVVATGLVWFSFAVTQWSQNTIGYSNLQAAEENGKLCYIKGYWERERPTVVQQNAFIFYMKDERGQVARVVYENGKPNNFEHATSVVVQGSIKDGTLYAKDILVKCPSKYQSEKADKTKQI